MQVLAIVVLTLISGFLLSIGAFVPFWICIGEIVVFSILLLIHLKGHYLISRYIFFSFSIIMEIYGSLIHGENGGYDYLFFVTALSPVLFFDKKKHYLSLFILSMTALVVVKVLYNHIEPELPLERTLFPYYTMIIISSLLIYFGYSLFKSEHLKYEQELQEQKDVIYNQRDTLLVTKTQLEELLQVSTQKLKEQNQGITKYAYLNSHKARSPLARILGLVNLTQYEDLDEGQTRSYYFNELKSNAKELDNVLTEISDILNRDIENDGNEFSS